MSLEGTASTIPTAEQTIEVQQESSKSSNEESAVEAEADVDQPQDNVEDGTQSSGSAAADDTSDEAVVADMSPRPQSSLQDSVAIGGVNMQDSQKTFSGGGSGTEFQQSGGNVMESQQGGEIGGGSNSELQQGDATWGTESQQGDATGGTESQQGGATGGVSRQRSLESASSVDNSCTESLQDYDSFTNSKFPSVICSPSRQDSQDSSSTGDPQETAAVGSSSIRASLESGVTGAISNSPDLQDSVAAGGSSIGDSQETAVIGDSSSQVSLESGVAGDVSNSPDSQESPANGTESWEGMAVPVLPPAIGAITSGRLPTRAVPRENEDERDQVAEDSTRAYEECFSKCAFICDYLKPCSRWIRKSKIFTFIRIGLVIIAIVAFTLGMSNLYRCPVKDELPILMVLLGIAGIVLLVTSWSLDSRSSFCPNIHRYYLTAGMVTAHLMFLGLFGAVLNSTYTMSPSFDPANRENYCNIVLYYFAYYTNFIIVGIVVLAFFVCVPTVNEDVNGYERL